MDPKNLGFTVLILVDLFESTFNYFKCSSFVWLPTFHLLLSFFISGMISQIMMDVSQVSRPLLQGNWMGAINALFDTSGLPDLLQVLLGKDLGPDANTVLLYMQGVASRLCEKVQIVRQNGTLVSMFETPSLRNMMHALTAIPDVVETLYHGFLTENLHRFLADHPIPKIIRIFPAPFCMQTETLDGYFNLTMRQRRAMEGLCRTNWNFTEILGSLMMEMVPLEIIASQGSVNFTAQARVNFTQVWANTNCIINTAISMNWPALVDIEKVTRVVNSFLTRFERVMELWPRTQGLLQLYLQPYLQGWPEFNNFPRMYKFMTRFTDLLATGKTFESLEGAFDTMRYGALFAKEFFNVNNTSEMTWIHSWLYPVKSWVGKFSFQVFFVFH